MSYHQTSRTSGKTTGQTASKTSGKIERRDFLKTFGTQWAQAFKKAQKNLDFPHNYKGIQYKLCRSNAPLSAPAVLTMADFPPFSLQTANIFTLEKNVADSQLLRQFIQQQAQEHVITAILSAHHLPPVTSKKQIIYMPDMAASPTATPPSLLLFENDEVVDAVHQIPVFLSQFHAGSDVYIGNIKNDLASGYWSPTHQRIDMFLAHEVCT